MLENELTCSSLEYLVDVVEQWELQGNMHMIMDVEMWGAGVSDKMYNEKISLFNSNTHKG